eukprot:3761977-Lingulodinium_polyedra.AAC.1
MRTWCCERGSRDCLMAAPPLAGTFLHTIVLLDSPIGLVLRPRQGLRAFVCACNDDSSQLY